MESEVLVLTAVAGDDDKLDRKKEVKEEKVEEAAAGAGC